VHDLTTGSLTGHLLRTSRYMLVRTFGAMLVLAVAVWIIFVSSGTPSWR
jgi:hypothetical protein